MVKQLTYSNTSDHRSKFIKKRNQDWSASDNVRRYLKNVQIITVVKDSLVCDNSNQSFLCKIRKYRVDNFKNVKTGHISMNSIRNKLFSVEFSVSDFRNKNKSNLSQLISASAINPSTKPVMLLMMLYAQH